MAPQRRIDVVLDSVKRLLRIGATANLFNLLQKQHPADLAAVLGELQEPEELSSAVLELMRPKESGQVENLLEYPEKTAGRIMNPNVFAVSEDLTVGEAITQLQASRDVEMVFYLYVVDQRRHLVGVTSLRRLLLVSPETPLKRIMTPDVISVRVDTDQEEAAQLVASYNLLAIPVVDEESKLVGVITVDDVIDVIKDEATEDIYRLAGVTSDERVFTPAGESLTKRLPWLAVNLVTAFVTASVVSLFEGTIQQVVALAVFMPIVAGMGGNAATQTLTVIVRGIALGELTWGNTRKALVKEAIVGLGNGFVLGAIGAVVVWLMKGNPVLGGVLALAMVLNMFIAATAGTLIPLGLRALRVDPALASSVFITTFTDLAGFVSFLGLATLFLRYLGTG